MFMTNEKKTTIDDDDYDYDWLQLSSNDRIDESPFEIYIDEYSIVLRNDSPIFPVFLPVLGRRIDESCTVPESFGISINLY
ncbi:hypothetical protein BLOT_014623 [Blomia tropicalis]|nr:hypothetical protein BLOT_014623 [Blomia tropicalis]